MIIYLWIMIIYGKGSCFALRTLISQRTLRTLKVDYLAIITNCLSYLAALNGLDIQKYVLYFNNDVISWAEKLIFKSFAHMQRI